MMKLDTMSGKELIEVADKYGVKVNCNKERTALKESKAKVIERIAAVLPKEEPKKEKKEKKSSKSLLVTFNGKTQTYKEWAEELGMPKRILYRRVHKLKWSVEKAFTTAYEPRK